MKYKFTKIAGLAGAAILAGTFLTSCSHATPSMGECAIVTGRGFGDKQEIKHVVHPGVKVGKGHKETPWYFPCNDRNYVTGDGGDRGASQPIKLQNGGSTPGTPVYVYSRMPFTLRQDDSSLKAWFSGLCLKYGCASNDPQENSSNSDKEHSSDPGWNNLLSEQVGPALDRAFQNVMNDPQYKGKFGSGIWTQGSWPELDKAVSAALPQAMVETSGLNLQWLCAPTANPEKNCPAPQVHITALQPTDPTIVTQYNQQIAATNAKAVNKARQDAAREAYGPEAGYFLGLQDLVKQCQAAKVTCNIYVGNPPGH